MERLIECRTCGYPLTAEEREGLVEIDGKMCKPSASLTDDRVWLEYMQLWPFRPNDEPTLAKDILRFARALERAHGIEGEE